MRASDITITVVYDNNPYKQGLETAWGFSCLITGTKRTILFDTGRDVALLGNMQKLAVDPNSIELVVLSHIHRDHTGGLQGFLERNAGVTVYLPKSFPAKFKDGVQEYGAKMVEVGESLKICEHVYSTGQVGKWIIEQSLVIRTDKGLVLIAGCAHPGIIRTAKVVKPLLKDDILLVMGGFHLEWASGSKIEKIISAFTELGVRCAGPCHCSGDRARTLFEKRFGDNYINIGAGKAITVRDLQ